MALKYYNSVADQSTVGNLIESDVLGALIPARTPINNDDILRKLWVEFDGDYSAEAFTVYPDSRFGGSIFFSESDNDALGDLTGNEREYGGFEVDSVDDDTHVTISGYDASLIQVNDKVLLELDNGMMSNDVASIADNGDGTAQLELTTSLNGGSVYTVYPYLPLNRSISAGDKIPVWVKSPKLPEPLPSNEEGYIEVKIYGA